MVLVLWLRLCPEIMHSLEGKRSGYETYGESGNSFFMLDTFISFVIGNTRDAPRSKGCVLWGTVLEGGDVDWSELYKRANCPFIYWIWFIAWRSLWFEYLVECNLQWWSRLLIWRSLTHRTSQGSCIVCNVLAFAFARGSIPARILRGRRNESSANSSSQLHVSAAMAE